MPKFTFIGLAAVFLGAGCTTPDELASSRVGQATLSFANGLPAATAQLFSDGQTVRVLVGAAALEPGEHGFHLHAIGSCTAPDFTSAGPHLNPGGRKHGSLSAGGPHLGDMPNLVVGADRTGTAEVVLPGAASNVLADIFDADGTAIVIHADPDDYRSDPAGNAGPRVACGVIKRV